MPVTVPEVISDLPALLALYQSVSEAVATLPPTATRKAVDYAVALKIPPESPVYQVLALVDSVEAQAKS